MKKTNNRLRTKFAPEVRFELNPVPFRAAETTELEKLKDRLLRQLLEDAIHPDQNLTLRRAANDAAALAWASRFPLLVFPALLDEKARLALTQWHRQAGVFRRSSNLLLKAA